MKESFIENLTNSFKRNKINLLLFITPVVWICSCLIFLHNLTGFSVKDLFNLEPNIWYSINPYLQIMVIICIIIFTWRQQSECKIEKGRFMDSFCFLFEKSEYMFNESFRKSHINLNVFLKNINRFWLSLIMVYLIIACKNTMFSFVDRHQVDISYHNSYPALLNSNIPYYMDDLYYFLSILEIFFNNLGAVFLLWCYFSFSISRIDWSVIKIVSIVVLALLSGTHVVLVLSRLDLISNFDYFFKDNEVHKIDRFFKIISGTLNAVFMCGLIGRLDSKLTGVRGYEIFLIYLYGIYQTAFSLIEINEIRNNLIDLSIQVFSLYMLLVLKVVFAYLLMRWDRNGNLIFYFLTFPEFAARVDVAHSHLEDPSKQLIMPPSESS